MNIYIGATVYTTRIEEENEEGDEEMHLEPRRN
jgi:hypothetical protein